MISEESIQTRRQGHIDTRRVFVARNHEFALALETSLVAKAK